ncbi:hypothetical protein K2173_009218 [Erythroxylum novogranatense]|uniref:B-like cyclin n=1 Tax=Erythroxylum novogranatense TaxID=1862640 RepID=A0AAV8TLP7_9ROSI|nr:hypothetical protein K2173_009218 [Erythroxylum novogranatense]
MAIQQYEQTAREEHNPSFLLDALYCEEERWEEEEEEEEGEVLDEESAICSSQSTFNGVKRNSSFFPLSLLLEQDLFWDDEELLSLFVKEEEQRVVVNVNDVKTDSSLCMTRQEAVEWILKVNAHYRFSALTAIFAVNYLDRFICSPCYQRDKPWMIQLVAVTCLSLAAKVEETQVPLLLDLQVEGTKYVFEAKTIQRMELLVMSALKWKMHPVTPLSFIDHIIRRLGLKNRLHWEFLRRCECLVLSVVSDSRLSSYLPSVLATAIMMHVIDLVESSHPIDYRYQLLNVLRISEEKVDDCYELILELSKTRSRPCNSKSQKRKYEPIPSSPSGVIDAGFSDDSSNDSWTLSWSSVSSSPEPLFKKSRTQDQLVFVGSPS